MSLLDEVKTFNLPVKTASKILKEYIEKDTGKTVKSIQFVTGTRLVGYGMNESSESYLQNIQVVFEETNSNGGLLT